MDLMIREGEPQVTLKFLADSPSKLAISNFSDGMLKLFPGTAAHILMRRSVYIRPVLMAAVEHFYNLLEIVLTGMEISPGPREQHQALLYLSVGASEGVSRHKDRLG